MSKRFVWRWLLVALALHLGAAYFSAGYQNSDEHFQILEFLGAYLGRSAWSALPIEYVRTVRPWFQPFLYWLPIRALMSAGISNPFVWAGAARLLSALIGWVSVVALVGCVPLWIRDPRWQKIAVITLALTWYLPALHARHSSENLSGALFAIGLCGMVRWASRRDAFLAGGLLWGLAFEARYQVGFMVAGGCLWLALIARRRFSQLSLVALGIFCAVGFCTYLDFLGYGHWTFAPWNYFHFNLIEGYASVTDTSPWWDYFRRIWTETWPGLGFVCLTGLLVFWVLEPKHPLTWSTLPFFAVHVVIAHKETRFLFPLAHVATLCLVIALSALRIDSKVKPWVFKTVAWPLIGLNAVGLAAFTFWPAAPTMRFYSEVYDRATRGELKALRYSVQDPYLIGGIPMYFYRPAGLALLPTENSPAAGNFFYATPGRIAPSLKGRCEVLRRSLPDWELLKRLNNWTLYRCR
jgi:phosphatidylinositol glycan class B